ncbi:DUF1365 domain-containing protein [Pararhizobium mangrovi]|uniref:DUF1365 domain-containing protein n=2 Tax=Pararhizobium mangrovi TaxID=2590452 RepID=A0A506TZK9_9HYPH|nr:DUF1365 domain-containing protein [Pararhizobium mangrovi]
METLRPARARPHRLPPLALYSGKVMHARLKPVAHRFTYAVFSMVVDIDRLAEAGKSCRLLSVDRANVLSFHAADHVDGGHATLRAYVESLLNQAGLAGKARRVLLACYPRVLGYVFNPLSIYYAYDAEDRPIALIYAVRNTFGERHTYVCPIAEGEQTAAGIRQRCDKGFHVSPFVPMAMRYHFRIGEPAEALRWRILETDAQGPLLSATYSARRLPLNDRTVLGLLAHMPAMTWKVIAGIHIEAFRLWAKGARYIPRPDPPAPVSVHRAGIRLDGDDREGDAEWRIHGATR